MFELEYKDKYDEYMKKVSDSFMKMQELEIDLNDYSLLTQTHTRVQLRSIIWNGGLDWKFVNCGTTHLNSSLIDNDKKRNTQIAYRYLTENALTYDEWLERYKKGLYEELVVKTKPVVNGSDLNVNIYNCLNELSNSIGKTLNEYHWREFCGLMKTMEDEKMIEITFK